MAEGVGIVRLRMEDAALLTEIQRRRAKPAAARGANNPDIKEGMTRAEIDAAIARHAESETLYDQPYEDKKTVRVSGPFTVESLSPHRTISVEEKKQRPRWARTA